MGEVIPFRRKPARANDLSVLLWKSARGFHVTIFDHGFERETMTFESYEAADATASSWIFLGATIEDRVGGDGAAS